MVQVAQCPRSRVQSFAGQIKPVALAVGLAFGLAVGTMPDASAATLTVLNNNDTGAGSLRATVAAAAAGDTIVFGAVTGTIPLANQIDIGTSLTISGPGAANLTIAPSGTNRALNIAGASPIVTISGVTFQGNGTSTVNGAAIYHYAGLLVIQNSVFSGNVSTSKGGAIFNYGGPLTILSSTFTGNQASTGGAIFMYSGALAIQSSTFSGNVATGNGGAIYLYHSGALTITDSTLSGNQAAGNGGALNFYSAGASTITNSTISGNSSTGSGGAIFLYDQSLTVNNSTITGNSATARGGAFYLATETATNTLTLNSTIVANSIDVTGTRDIAGSGTVNATRSLIFNPAGSINGTNVANITNQNPLLGPLANNGGPTLTHALLGGSPAINAGSNTLALPFDQRGTPFLRSSGLTDIGSFEVQGAPPPPSAIVPVPTLSQWGLVILSGLMAGWAMLTGFGRRRRR
jgi:parallel beta-helix repeat protein